MSNKFPKKMLQKQVGKVLKRLPDQKNKRKYQTTGWAIPSTQLQKIQTNSKYDQENENNLTKDTL